MATALVGVVSTLAFRSAAADTDRVLLHLRGGVGPSGIALTGRGSAQVASATRRARSSFAYSYVGGGLSLEVGAGFSKGSRTHELIGAFDWYRGSSATSDGDRLERMGVELTPRLRTVFVGYGIGWPLSRGSIWRISLGGGFGVNMLDLEVRGAELEEQSFSGTFTGFCGIGPSWSLARTGPHEQSAVTLGLRVRLLAGFGLESAFVSPGLLAEIAFQ